MIFFKKILTGFLALTFLFSCYVKSEKENLLYINGRIEGNDYIASNKYPGKVARIYCDEGDNVKKGQLLAVLDSKEVSARVKQAKANYNSSISSLKAKEGELLFYENKLKALKVKLSQLKETVASQINIAKENLFLSEKNCEIAKSELMKAKATFERVKKDYLRFKNLYLRRVISEKRFDEIKNAFEVAKQNLESAEKNFEKSSRAIAIAREKLSVAISRRKEIDSLRDEINALKSTVKAKENEVQAFRKRVDAAKAFLEEMKAILKENVICSPVNGTITEKNVELGEVIPAGFRLFTIYNLDDLYFEGFIPETKIGLISIGQEGYVTVDSYPGRKFKAKVTFVSSRAEFTPKEVQTKEERVKQVFRIKMKLLENPDHVLKPGMPADAYIEIER
jgi:HlyD family secretion protein